MISEVSEPVDVVHVDRPEREFDHGSGAGEPHERGQFGSFGQGEATEVVVPGDVVGERAGPESGQRVVVELRPAADGSD